MSRTFLHWNKKTFFMLFKFPLNNHKDKGKRDEDAYLDSMFATSIYKLVEVFNRCATELDFWRTVYVTVCVLILCPEDLLTKLQP